MVSPSTTHRNASRAQSEGPRQGGVSSKRGQGQYKGIKARVLHLASLQRGSLILAQIATTLLHERLPWVTTVLYPTASERGECMLAMLFWVLAALAVAGALAIVWVLYLLARRWL